MVDLVAGGHRDRLACRSPILREREDRERAVSCAGCHSPPPRLESDGMNRGRGTRRKWRFGCSLEETGDLSVHPPQEPAAGERMGEGRLGGDAGFQLREHRFAIAGAVRLEGAAKVASGLGCRKRQGSLVCDDLLLSEELEAHDPFADNHHSQDQRQAGGSDPDGDRRTAPRPAAQPLQGRERPGDRRPAVEKPRQIDGQLSGGGIAIIRFLRQAFQTDGNEIGRDAGHDPVGRLGVDLKDPLKALRR